MTFIRLARPNISALDSRLSTLGSRLCTRVGIQQTSPPLFGSIEFLISVSDAFADRILTVTVPRELTVSLYHLAVLGLWVSGSLGR